jgi:hypothetical protein
MSKRNFIFILAAFIFISSFLVFYICNGIFQILTSSEFLYLSGSLVLFLLDIIIIYFLIRHRKNLKLFGAIFGFILGIISFCIIINIEGDFRCAGIGDSVGCSLFESLFSPINLIVEIFVGICSSAVGAIFGYIYSKFKYF